MKKIIAILLIATMMFALIAACATDTAPDGTARPPAQDEQPTQAEQPGNDDQADPDLPLAEYPGDADGLMRIFRKTQPRAISHLNPLDSGDSLCFMAIDFTQMHLLKRHPTNASWDFIGDAAVDMPEVSDCGMIWTFTIREGLAFSDGYPINAHTWEFHARMLLDPYLNNRQAEHFFNRAQIVNSREFIAGEVEWDEVGVRALDDYTIEYRLENPVNPMVVIHAIGRRPIIHPPSFEAGFNEDRTENTYGTSDFLNMPVSGVYQLVHFEPDQFLVFDRRPEHVHADLYPAERIEWRVVPDPVVASQLFEQGLTDWLVLGPHNFHQFREDPRMVIGTAGTPLYISFNLDYPNAPISNILNDQNFRNAMFWGIDRDGIAAMLETFIPAPFTVKTETFVGDFFAGEPIVTFRNTPEGMANIRPNNGFDPDRALEYFELAWEANGRQKIEIDMVFSDVTDRVLTSEFIQESLSELFGRDRFELVLRGMPAAAAHTGTTTYGNDPAGWHMVFAGIGMSTFDAWTSPMLQFSSYHVTRFTRWGNAEFDAGFQWFLSREGMEATEQQRIEHLAMLENMILTELPVVPVKQGLPFWMFSDRVTLHSREAEGFLELYTNGGFTIVELTPIEPTPFN